MIFFVLYIYSFIMVVGSDDWLIIWMGLEVNMMSFLFLFYRKKSMNNIESCMKYFFIQSLGSALFIGVVYLYISSDWVSSCILSYKLGAGPFFFWFPSVIDGLNWVGAFFLMTFQKILPLVLLIMFISWVVWFILIVSLVVGVLGSFNQSKMKFLFAYSSIHHLGWLLMCSFVDNGIWFFYLLMYGMVLSVVFMMYYYEIDSFMDIMKWKNKWWFFLGVMSMAGVPPLLGFFLKWLAFYYILNINLYLVVMMVLMSVIMFYIYVRVVYDIMVGGVFNIGWCYTMYNCHYFFSLDFLMFLGVFIGSILGLMMLT
uniref:NADH-ubiquinone oxidoreductase chain 2 n=1 Tax=Agelena silvatica TaxID=648239 RepID=A0A1P8VZ76_9ARAC|nr:NADH dehydrogenase subunit 2 [Agelena silvatica]APZ83998.1 NADH dehydrogenase subunit 2 [Agelena silvatica]